MPCARCQHDNPAGTHFCGQCGARLAVACPACGAPNPPSNKFCGACGEPLTREVGASKDTAPDAYTPRHLAERILTCRSALEGERKQVTVLFCDVVDSSRLARELGPEGMHEVMDRVLRLMTEAVHRYEGTVNQFLGDGLMALFGAPLTLEDHALRAVQAALAIRETVAGYSEQLKTARRVEIRLRLGLNTGPVVVGRIGDDLRMDYTAVGDTTHLAARLQALAEPDAILVTEATHRLAAAHARSEGLGPMPVKGWSEPVSVYRITGRRRLRSRIEVMAERGLTPLVGRQRELGLLHDCLTRATAGRGQIVGIAGEPGAGKSRLLHEFRKSVEGRRLTWLEGHCVAYGQATPYGPILEILRANFQIEDGDNALQICEKLRQGVRRLDPALESLLPFLGDLFGLAAEDEALRHLDSKERRQKAFEAIRALTLAGSQRRPHVVIVEDLHWIDRTSEDYLAFLSDSVAGTPLLLVTTHRPGYAVRWAEKTYYTRIALGLLSEGEAEEMISGLLATRQAPRELLQVVLAKAEGNPLFVEELTAALLERGLLTRTEGRIPPAEVRELEIPATIQDIIRARIDRLEEPVKRTVQTAAVIGREFGLRLLARISEMAEEVQRYLDTLKHLELIHETRVFPELEYIFKHAVTQDVAYQSLLGQRRRELHGAIGRAMEELYADRLEEQAAILTYHYARSTCEDKAIEYALLAGDRAARLYATAEARAYYEQAHITAHAQAPSPEARRLEIDTILKLPTVAVTRQHFEGDLQSLEHALALAERLDDRPRLSRVLYWLGRIQYTMGRHDAGIEYAEKALDLAEALGDENLAAPPVNLLGRGRFMRGEYERVRGLLARNVQQMRTIGNRIEEATASGMLGLSHAQLGQFSEALAACEEGVRVAEAVGHLPTLAACLLYRGITSSHFGEWSPALRDFETALEAAERSGDVFRAFIIRANRGGWCYLLSGDHGRAIEELTQALALADRVGTRWFLGGWLGYLAEARLGAGDVAEALRLGREAVQIASESASPWEQSVAFRALAQALLAQDPPDSQGAEEAIGRAIAIQEGFQMKWELPQSLLVRGRVLRAQGHAAEARAVLDQALKLFEAMGVSWGVEKAEQALRDP